MDYVFILCFDMKIPSTGNKCITGTDMPSDKTVGPIFLAFYSSSYNKSVIVLTSRALTHLKVQYKHLDKIQACINAG